MTCAYNPTPASYTVGREESALATIRDGFVSYFMFGSRSGPFPGSRPAQPSRSRPFWLRSVILARLPVLARDHRQHAQVLYFQRTASRLASFYQIPTALPLRSP